jgi:hypothetical protein
MGVRTFGRCEMGPPTYNSSLAYVVSVEGEIREATSSWKAYGYAVSWAYSKAYNDQGTVLSDIKQNLEQLRKKEEMVASLALTILTVGVAGPFAAAATNEVFERGADVVKEQWVHLVNIGLEKTAEWASENLGSTSADDAFQPSGITPDQYGDSVQQAVETYTGFLEDTVLDFLRKGSENMTLDGAKKLYEAVLKTDFIRNPPKVTDTHKLRERATLALWLAWAWSRDVGYWRKHNDGTIPRYREELEKYEPLRKLLHRFPMPAWDQRVYDYAPKNKVRRPAPSLFSRDDDDDGDDLPTGHKTLIDMMGFLEWSVSHGARAALLSGMPAHPEGQRYAEVQMTKHFLEVALRRLGFDVSDNGLSDNGSSDDGSSDDD